MFWLHYLPKRQTRLCQYISIAFFYRLSIAIGVRILHSIDPEDKNPMLYCIDPMVCGQIILHYPTYCVQTIYTICCGDDLGSCLQDHLLKKMVCCMKAF